MDGPVQSASLEELDLGVFFYQGHTNWTLGYLAVFQPVTFQDKKVVAGNVPESNP